MVGFVDVVVMLGVSTASFTVLCLSMNSCRFEFLWKVVHLVKSLQVLEKEAAFSSRLELDI
jgi:hypothetical protein